MYLFTSLSTSQTDEAKNGDINQSAGQTGRAANYTITTALQMDAMKQHRGDETADLKAIPWDDAALTGSRAADRYDFGLLSI